MPNDVITATTTVDASADTVFAILADPAQHAAIDGTGWVRESLDGRTLTEAGQIFRIAMYHDNVEFDDGHYEMANKVVHFDRPHGIAWEPGQRPANGGDIEFGGWIWRYDLTAEDPARTRVTLTYDWSGVGSALREHIEFPPFAIEHLHNSLDHLAELARRG
ncbi:SRPBCC family protein [Mycobacterium sp. CPCC 205372]|uniref:SRPBCC family protein n=1 Tax=Mycobacterium hippophais TaxID=3016340 RepID=A0ABT4PXC6_9MYCO|nr:SRPBCC family protein [Mycobacterium hippophais]MCZ8381206.1 SRPBCC family protein [Mycobacterium hippophais]